MQLARDVGVVDEKLGVAGDRRDRRRWHRMPRPAVEDGRNEGERRAIIGDQVAEGRDDLGRGRPGGRPEDTRPRAADVGQFREGGHGRLGRMRRWRSATGSGARHRERSSQGRCRPAARVGAAAGQPRLQLRGDIRVAELQREPGVRERLEPREPFGRARRRRRAEDADRGGDRRDRPRGSPRCPRRRRADP